MGKLRVVAVLAAALVGCGNRTPRPPKVDDPENQVKLAKLQAYIKCLDGHSAHLFALADLVRDHAATIAATPDPDSCVKGIIAALPMQPAMPETERAAAAFSATLSAVHALSVTGAKSFDDATRNELATKLAEFERAQGALFDSVRRVNRDVHLDQMNRREQKDGKTLLLRAERAVFHAEGLMSLTATTPDRLDVIDIAALQKQLTELEAMEQDLSTYALIKPQEATDFDGFYSFLLHLHNFVVATRELMVRARDKIAYTDAEKLLLSAKHEEGVNGTPAAVVDKYNFLVQVFGFR